MNDSAAVSPRGGRVGVAVLGRRRLGGERHREPVEHVLEVLPRVGLQRGQHLVELHRRRRLGDLERAAVLEDSAPTASRDLRSTKKLPSRKIRGRILAVASACSGSPSSSIYSTTTAASVPSSGSTDATLPTCTPAIRTGDPGRIEFADSNVARTWNGVVNGKSFVNPKNTIATATVSAIRPMSDGAARLAATHQGVFSVVACWRPAELPMIVWPATYGSLPASHSFG